ncbi:MAG: pyridoxamine 5'-phosphate oxidase family protein [Deltaproteobacteria bacterium]|nr:pyridoxamine 5'-phosphate oxidase family protein [Deltaproteobacteria bacterium]
MGHKNEVLQTAWEGREGPIVFSTVDERGVPNAIYCNWARLLEDGRFLVADNYFHKTRENILKGSPGSVLFFTTERKSYQAKGKIEYQTAGPLYEEMRQWVDPQRPRVAAAVLQVDELYRGAEKLL